MKKHLLFFSCLICLITILGYNVYQSQSKVPLSDIMKANIEALASGEEGTPASRCYLRLDNGIHSMNYFCDEKTNDDKIFPCPDRADFGYLDENKKDRCTK